MVSVRPAFSIPVTENITTRISPETYYLKMDGKDGMYLNTTFSLSRKNFPLAVTALINKALRSNIISEYDLLWNVGVSYTFNNSYVKK